MKRRKKLLRYVRSVNVTAIVVIAVGLIASVVTLPDSSSVRERLSAIVLGSDFQKAALAILIFMNLLVITVWYFEDRFRDK